MTIRPGDAWGRSVARPSDLAVAATDAELAEALVAARRTPAHVGVGGGDLARTLGNPPLAGRAELNELPIDLVAVTLASARVDAGPTGSGPTDTRSIDGTGERQPHEPTGSPAVCRHTACAHVVACLPWWRGGWLRGPVLIVMNAQFHGAYDVAPRGHPNDGRVEVFEIAAPMTVRDRLVARRRARHAGHVPHPSITTRSVRRAAWDFDTAMRVSIDGRSVGRARWIEVVVEADAAVVFA